jgi:hypothetical protein
MPSGIGDSDGRHSDAWHGNKIQGIARDTAEPLRTIIGTEQILYSKTQGRFRVRTFCE